MPHFTLVSASSPTVWINLDKVREIIQRGSTVTVYYNDSSTRSFDGESAKELVAAMRSNYCQNPKILKDATELLSISKTLLQHFIFNAPGAELPYGIRDRLDRLERDLANPPDESL